MKDNSMMHDATPLRPVQRRIFDVQAAQERVPDLECNDGMRKLDEMLIKDQQGSGCNRYLVFYEGDGRFLAWRDED